MKSATLRRIGTSAEGFTLIEVIVVMVIFAALAAISWSGFYGLRTAMILHQSAETFRSDVVYAQRSAMLLKRQAGESYVRGVFIDFQSLLEPEDEEYPNYSVYKWCSDSMSYVEYDTKDTIGNTIVETCNIKKGNSLAKTDKTSVELAGGRLDVCITDAGRNGSDIQGVLFEAVNGRVHYYKPIPSGEFSESPGLFPRSVRVAFYRGDRWDAVIIHETGKIELETWDGTDPCEIST